METVEQKGNQKNKSKTEEQKGN